MNPHPSSSAVVGARRATIMAGLVFLGLAAHAVAQNYVSSEDRSRFREVPYKKAEPGMLAPAAYIQMAKNAVHSQTNEVHFNIYSDGIVTHRFYRDAPAADRDIICVRFVYQGVFSGGGTIGSGFIAQRADPAVPVIQALIRKDLSKTYLNRVDYKHE